MSGGMTPQKNNNKKPKKNLSPKDQTPCNLKLSRRQFYGNEVNFFVLTATDWNHFSDYLVKVPHSSSLQMTDHHCKHQLTRVHTPLLSHLNQKLGPATYAIKIKNCNITKPRAPMRSRLQFLMNFHFQLKWFSFVK